MPLSLSLSLSHWRREDIDSTNSNDLCDETRDLSTLIKWLAVLWNEEDEEEEEEEDDKKEELCLRPFCKIDTFLRIIILIYLLNTYYLKHGIVKLLSNLMFLSNQTGKWLKV